MLKKIENIINKKNFEYFLLFIILILGFVVRLYKINNPVADWHSWRQADTASVTRFFVSEGVNLLTPKYHDISSIQTGIFNPKGYRMVELPIYNLISTIFIKQFPFISLEVWSRLVTILAALITGLFLYLIGKRLMGKWGGLLTSFFYLFIPYNIYFTRTILPDPLGVTFSVVSLWAFLKFSEDEGEWYMFLSAIFFALAMLIKPYLAFYLIPITYLAIKKYGLKTILKNRVVMLKAVMFTTIIFVPFFAYRIWESRFPEGIPFYKWAFNGSGIRFKPSFWYWIFGQRLSHLILGGLGMVPFIFGVLNKKPKNSFINYSLFGVFVYVLAVASANVMHDYYQITIIPVIALTLASGTVFLWNQTYFDTLLTRTVLVISVGVMLITGWSLVKDNFNINHPEIIEAGKRVDEITPKDALVIATYNGDTAFLYQTKRSGWPVLDNSIDNIIEEGATYFASVDLGSKDTVMIASRFKTIEKTDKYIIIDLTSPLKIK